MLRKNITKKSVLRRAHALTKRAVMPLGANDYRPYLVRSSLLIVFIVVMIGFQLSYNFVQTGSVLGVTTNITSPDLLGETNAQRSAAAEKPLQLNAKLSAAAADKARDMFAKQYWAHISPTGTTPWAWFKKVDYNYVEAGENLARGFGTSGGVVTAWMNSVDHRANILDPNYSDVGFAVQRGVLDGKATTLVVALYGQPAKDNTYARSINDPGMVLAAKSINLNPLTRLGIGIQSMAPVLLGSIVLILFVALVALMAHAYRKRLPFAFRRDWHRHHGLYKAVGMMSLVVILVMLYGGGR